MWTVDEREKSYLRYEPMAERLLEKFIMAEYILAATSLSSELDSNLKWNDRIALTDNVPFQKPVCFLKQWENIICPDISSVVRYFRRFMH